MFNVEAFVGKRKKVPFRLLSQTTK